jgi:thioredoxin 1
MQKVTDDNYDSVVGDSGLPVMLDFGATWCGPCKKLDPIMEELSGEMADKLVIGKVDVGESPAVAKKFGIMSVPTVIFLRDGAPVHRFSGVESKEKITSMLSQHLGV